MQIQPILAALKKHRLATFLIAMEIALACAVLVNAVFLIANHLSAMNLDSGVDEGSLGAIVVTGFDPKRATDLNARMTAGLGAIPGVESVHVISSVPLGPQWGGAGMMIMAKPSVMNRNPMITFSILPAFWPHCCPPAVLESR